MTDPTTLSRRAMLVMPLALAACKFSRDVLEITGLTMGTSYKVVAANAPRELDETALRAAVETALAEVNGQMSNWDDGSEISRFNGKMDTDALEVSAPLAAVMQAAETVHLASDGRFDTTMGPLIELWGFGANGTLSKPGEAALEAARARAGHSNTLTVGTSSLQKRQPDAQVYLAAIGKGYGADHAARAVESLGVTDYMVEIGGDLYTKGRNPDGMPWQIGIEKPAALSGGILDVVGVSGMGLASSGDYRNYYEEDGQRYSHIIDPATGRPITHKTASVTVLAENAMLADAWATAMLTLGRERGLEIAKTQNLAVMFIDRDGANGDLRFKPSQSPAFSELTA